MINKKVLGIPYIYPFFETYKKTVLEVIEPHFLSSALFFVPYNGFKHILIDFFQHHYPQEIVKTLTICTFSEPEDWTHFLNQSSVKSLKPLKPLQRRHLMVNLLLSLDKQFLPQQTPLHTWITLAEEILLFLDEVYQTQNETTIFKKLDTFFTSDLAHHWGVTIEYLQEIVGKWPLLLEQLGYMEPLLYHRLALQNLLKNWKINPPIFPVIALGFQEATPAVKMLLKGLLTIERGQIILNYDRQAHFLKNPGHPLHSCHRIIQSLDLSETDISIMTPVKCPVSPLVPWLLSSTAPSNNTGTMTLENHASLIQEVQALGTLIKHYYDHSNKRLAFIAPPGDLSNCLKIVLKKLNIPFSCSSAIPLRKTILAQLSWLSLSIALSTKNTTHIFAFWNFCQPLAIVKRPLTVEDLAALAELALPLQKVFHRFSFQRVVNEHKQTLIRLFTYCTHHPAPYSWKTLFEKCEGFDLLNDIFENISSLSLPVQQAHEYQIILEQAFQVLLPCTSLFQERVMILRPFESVFVNTDVAIIGDLNEGTWPVQKRDDMWLPSFLRKEWGLPDILSSIGTEAQFFLQSCTAPEIILSRSLKNYGQSTVASRWLLQLQMALKKNDFLEHIPQDYSKSISSEIKKSETVIPSLLKSKILDYSLQSSEIFYNPCPPPQPCPPFVSRPRQLSVTAIEQWMRDPYSIYARYILKLKPLENEPQPAAERGIFIHKAIEQWLKSKILLKPLSLNNETELDNLLNIAQKLMKTTAGMPAMALALWWPRFLHIARWFVQQMSALAPQTRAFYSEIKGKMTFSDLNFVITAEADRLDWREENENKGWVIVDYKTGSLPSMTDVKMGFSPQLPLEALICQNQGFLTDEEFTPFLKSIEYWHLKGDVLKPGKIVSLTESIESLLDQTEQGLKALIQLFDKQQTPYLSCPRPDKAPLWRTYDHLARCQEWS